MRKVFITTGIAICCLFALSASSGTLSTKSKTHANATKNFSFKKRLGNSTAYWFNSNAYTYTMEFWAAGNSFPYVCNISAGYSSGSFDVPPGTYTIHVYGSSPCRLVISGHTDQQGTYVTMTNVVMPADQGVTMDLHLPE